MTPQPNFKISIVLMLIFFVAGIVCYAYFTPPEPSQPIRLMFMNKAGKVLFKHSGHIEDYGLECIDCHHNLEDDEVYHCNECHESTGDDDMPSIADAFHKQCKGCHEDSDAGPVECNSCHTK